MSLDSEDQQRHPVEVLADEFASRIRRGESPSIGEYADAHPEYADQIQAIFPSIAMVERVSLRGGEKQHSDARSQPAWNQSPEVPPASLGDYQIVREIGRGGMGVIYEAVQKSLHRRVALKVVHVNIAQNGPHRARFQREAESAASLHHTNIVPIYGIGEDQNLQYYAMQLIDGVTLQDILECLRSGAEHNELDRPSEHLADSSTDSNRTKKAFSTLAAAQWLLNLNTSRPESDIAIQSTGSPPSQDLEVEKVEGAIPPSRMATKLTKSYYRNVARLIANVANALDYAHHQHVLHRDIKPANLLLDREGTIWVTDFGLARRTDLDSATQTGEILGTIRYMAPEQMAGRGDSRIDIYSLGLTLYELLTLRPAIESPKARLLDPERNSTIAVPRTINPNIPIDLQTIAMKACSYAPEHRYADGHSMEEDLLRFMEDRPILAKRTSKWESLMRWSRRNPAIAILASSTLILVAGIISTLALWNRQQETALHEIGVQFQRAEKSLQEKAVALSKVEKENARAEANLELSLRAFDRIMDNIAARGSTLVLGSQVEDLEWDDLSGASLSQADLNLLESLLEFFDRFSEMNEKDLRVETAVARQRVGDIQHKLGKLDDAEASYRKAIEVFQHANRQLPDRMEVVVPMLSVYNEMLLIAAKRGQLLRVPPIYQDARQLLEHSPKTSESAEGRFALAKLLNSMGTLSAKFNRDPRSRPSIARGLSGIDALPPPQAIRLQREREFNNESLQILESLVHDAPDHPGYCVVLARTLKDEVRIARTMNDTVKSEVAMQRSIELLDELCRSHPTSFAFKYELADSLSTFAGHREKDMQRLQRAYDICEEMLKVHSDTPEYRALKAAIMAKQSLLLQFSSGRSPKAEELLLDAIAIQQDLASRYTDVALYSLALVQSFVQLSDLHMSRKKPDRAITALSNAVATAENFQKRNKGTPMLRQQIERLRERRHNLENRAKDQSSPSN